MTTTLDAYAKLTVHLHITGVRGDGMHLIDAEMVSLDFHDTLQFGDGDSLHIQGDDLGTLSTGDDNLVRKAAKLAELKAAIHLTKRIPIGGGLGGGSTDAAAVLRFAEFTDLAAAARIGADIPFCMVGGRARVRGIGEIVDPLPFEPRTFTLLLPPFGVNTAAVYRAFDEASQTTERGEIATREVNELQAAAISVEPRLAVWRDRFADWTGVTPILAGSGSTWFVEGAHEKPSAGELGDARWIVARTVSPQGE